jgi:hypothetical protein
MERCRIPSIVGFVVDKNGFTATMSTSRYSRGSSHTTGMFLRRECVARLCGGKLISIPEELPLGVQLRVSALRLLNTVICRHTDGFFDADSTTPIGTFLLADLFLPMLSVVSPLHRQHSSTRNKFTLQIACVPTSYVSTRGTHCPPRRPCIERCYKRRW